MSSDRRSERKTGKNVKVHDADQPAPAHESDTAMCPDYIRQVKWLMENWRTHKLAILCVGLLFYLPVIMYRLVSVVADCYQSSVASVSARVIQFNYQTGQLAVEFINKTKNRVPVETIYVTVAPTNSAPLKALSAELASCIPILAKSALVVPAESGMEFGEVEKFAGGERRSMRYAAFYALDTSVLSIPPGTITTNMVPIGNGYSAICALHDRGSVLEVVLHTQLVDNNGDFRVQHIVLGDYIVGDKHTGFACADISREVDILRAAKNEGSRSGLKKYTFVGTGELPPLNDTEHRAIMMNTSSCELVLSMSDRFGTYIPVVFVKKIICYGCSFEVELINQERIINDFSKWVLTCDKGKTVMNLQMAVSDTLAKVALSEITCRSNSIPLPVTNWQVLVEGTRWANITKGAVIFDVRERGWSKLMPVAEVTTSLLLSNCSNDLQKLGFEESWVPFTNYPTSFGGMKEFVMVRLDAIQSSLTNSNTSSNIQPAATTSTNLSSSIKSSIQGQQPPIVL